MSEPARILQLPTARAEGSETRLLDLLERWASNDWWTGPQDVLGRELEVDPRTVRRWARRLEERGLIAVRQDGRTNTYLLLGRRSDPDTTADRPPIRLEVPQGARDPQSSSSSNPGHPTPDTPSPDITPDTGHTQDTGSRDHGSLPPDNTADNFRLTPAALFLQLQLEPTPALLEAWAHLDDDSRAIALNRLRHYGARTPRYALQVLETVRVLQQASRLPIAPGVHVPAPGNGTASGRAPSAAARSHHQPAARRAPALWTAVRRVLASAAAQAALALHPRD